MKNEDFTEQIKSVLCENIPSGKVFSFNINQDVMAGIAFTHTITAMYQSDKDTIVKGEWVVNSTGEEEAIQLLPLVIEASLSYRKTHANELMERFGSNKQALESANNSKNAEDYYSLAYHKWDYIIKDLNKLT